MLQIHSTDTNIITNVFATLPTTISIVPQRYTIHCTFKNDSSLQIRFLMGNAKTKFNRFCKRHSKHLSCLQRQAGGNISNKTLTITWKASTVLSSTELLSNEPVTNGDHSFVCEADTSPNATNSITESTFITIRGIAVQG